MSLKSLALSCLPDAILRPLKKRHYLSVLKAFDVSEEPDLAMAICLVKPGTVVLDIGANIGVYTTQIARAFPDVQLISFEPVPETFSYLKNNVEQLGIQNATLHQVAVSNFEGTVQMEVPSYASGGKNFYQSRISNNDTMGGGGIPVRAAKLDTLVADVSKPISFIKIDVEGHELSAIEGAQETLRKHHPAILIEVSENPDDANSSAGKLFALFTALGYTAQVHDGNALRPRRTGEQFVNYFFT